MLGSGHRNSILQVLLVFDLGDFGDLGLNGFSFGLHEDRLRLRCRLRPRFRLSRLRY